MFRERTSVVSEMKSVEYSLVSSGVWQQDAECSNKVQGPRFYRVWFCGEGQEPSVFFATVIVVICRDLVDEEDIACK